MKERLADYRAGNEELREKLAELRRENINLKYATESYGVSETFKNWKGEGDEKLKKQILEAIQEARLLKQKTDKLMDNRDLCGLVVKNRPRAINSSRLFQNSRPNFHDLRSSPINETNSTFTQVRRPTLLDSRLNPPHSLAFPKDIQRQDSSLDRYRHFLDKVRSAK